MSSLFSVLFQGSDVFSTKINIEVQWASEETIAAVERVGGTITTAYYDIFSVKALSNARHFFMTGQPIPKRLTPPANCIGYYTNPDNRGYLADPAKVAEARFTLAQKYGYELPDISKDADAEMLREVKDPRQVFFGLQPGWIVSLKEKAIFQPLDPEIKAFYSSGGAPTEEELKKSKASSE